MSLIKSISGIRGTIGGKASDHLTPIDAYKFAASNAIIGGEGNGGIISEIKNCI
jgi:hypothetical protein